jgi:hypothetical protein
LRFVVSCDVHALFQRCFLPQPLLEGAHSGRWGELSGRARLQDLPFSLRDGPALRKELSDDSAP